MEGIDKKKEEKLKDCWDEIQKVLEKYHAVIGIDYQAKQVFEQKGIFANIVLDLKQDADNQNQ